MYRRSFYSVFLDVSGAEWSGESATQQYERELAGAPPAHLRGAVPARGHVVRERRPRANLAHEPKVRQLHLSTRPSCTQFLGCLRPFYYNSNDAPMLLLGILDGS